jgi:AcrR family transcriptional regulator
MGRKRATTEQERAALRRRILDATATLLARWSLEDVNVDRIAALAGIAKGTVYLYFRTREELVLEVFDRCHGLWLDALEARLREDRAPLSPDEVARLTVSTLLDNLLLVRLYGQIGAVIKGSVSPEASHRIRLRQTTRMNSTALALESRLPGVTSTQAARWLFRFEAFTAGIAPLAQPPRAVAAAFADPGRTAHNLDLKSELQYIAVTMLLSP